MSLLREIQAEATDPKTSLSSVLLKCQLLAARLGYEPLSEWVHRETVGYSNDDQLPPYRILAPVDVTGTLSGPFGARVENMPIPFTIIDQQDWVELFHVEFRGGIGGYEHLAVADGQIGERWPAHMIQKYSQKPITQDGMHLVDARKLVSKGAVVSMLTTVRSRIITLATDLERANPGAGEAVPGTNPVPRSALESITAVVSGNATIMTSARDMSVGSESVIGPAAGDAITGSGRVEGDSISRTAGTVNVGDRSAKLWFVRHPWISGLIVATVAGIPAIYVAIAGSPL